MAIKDEIFWCDRGWQPLEYCFIPTKKAWKKFLKQEKLGKLKYPTSAGRVTTFTNHVTGRVICAVTFRDDCEKTVDQLTMTGLIVHEATHVYQDVVANMQEKEPGIEFHAYAMQCITQELIAAFIQSGRKFKK